MNLKSIEETVRKRIVSQFDLKPNEVTPESSLTDDLGADSLDLVELVMAIEEEFDIEITDDESERLRTVQDVINHINTQLNQKA